MSSPAMAPVSAGERIEVIDILRGVALFGILAANMRAFNAPFEVYGHISKLFPGPIDRAAQLLIDAFISTKCVTLFSFLFGLGFAVQMSRAEERGRSVSFYPRRLTILLVIGLIHGWLIWIGDILACYALTGFLLFFFRKRQQKTVAIWAIVLALSPFVIATILTVAKHYGLKLPFGGTPDDPAKLAREIQQSIHTFRDGSYWGMVQYRFHEWVGLNVMLPFEILLFTLPRFLLGLWVFRSGLLQNPEAHLPSVKRVMTWGLMLGVITEIVRLGLHQRYPNLRFGTWQFLASMGAFSVAPYALAAFYAGGVLMLSRIPEWRDRLAPFAAVGRMALTNYLTQSLFFTWFYRLTHTFGSVGPALGLVPTVIFFAIQIWFSVWWLKHYQFGPVEWLWRSLTYGAVQPMRRRSDDHLLDHVPGYAS